MPPEGSRLALLFRALVTAVAIVVLIPTGFAVAGAFFPRAPVVGPFGLIMNTGFPWVLGAAVVGAGLSGFAVLLSGRKALPVVVVGIAILLGAGLIGYRYVTFAQANGASYDLARAADGFPQIPEPDVRAVISTADGADLKTEIWLPLEAATASASMPSVVFVHGGAFIGGGPGTRPLMLAALRSSGIVALDIDYRLSPPPRWNQAPGDVLCALAWLRSADAPEGLRAIDPTRVVVVGESAGGSLALVAGYAAGTEAIASSCPARGAPVVPAGVVAIAPTADLAGIWEDATIYDGPGRRFPEAYTGGPPQAYPERYDAASPFRLLRPDLPPTLLLTGEIDRLVLVGRTTALADRIRGAGASVELLVAPFAGHGFDGEPNSFGNQLAEGVVPYFVRRVTSKPG